MTTKFWLNDFKVLYENGNYLLFLPNTNYNFIENLNAITRLALYYSILCFIYNNNIDSFVPFLIISIITLLLYKSSDYIIETFDNKEKRKSTPDNPMINLNITDYGNGEINKIDINDKNINSNLTNNLYTDIGDLSNKQCFERNFYTTPITTVPNDQGAFAEWLYKTNTCKSGDMDECVKNMGDRYILR